MLKIRQEQLDTMATALGQRADSLVQPCGGEVENDPLSLNPITIDDKKAAARLQEARHTSGKEFELAVGASVIIPQVIPELEEEHGIPIKVVQRGQQEFNYESREDFGRAKWQRGHRSSGEFREPDLSLEIKEPGGGGALKGGF